MVYCNNAGTFDELEAQLLQRLITFSEFRPCMMKRFSRHENPRSNGEMGLLSLLITTVYLDRRGYC